MANFDVHSSEVAATRALTGHGGTVDGYETAALHRSAGGPVVRFEPQQADRTNGSVATISGHAVAPLRQPGIIEGAARRAVDLAVASVMLVLTAPVMVVLGIIVRLDSPGPIVFRQIRIGRGRHPFAFYKFRTMCVDARSRFPELYSYRYTDQQIQTMYFKTLDDPRLTRFGRWLRKTSLDELPNLINVVRGDMALVGPRPELPEMLPYYSPEQLLKFAVKPGVTGLAQINGRGLLRFQETIASDLEYCHQQSFGFDMLVIMRTIKCVVLRVGAF